MERRESLDCSDSVDLCDFCYPSADRSILYEDETAYVMPSLGQFVEGYLLLINKDHRECVAEATNDQFRRVKAGIEDALSEVYGTHCFFEHGRVGNCYQRSTNRICFHAHLHCLPLPGGFVDRIAADFDGRVVEGVSELRSIREEMPHYLYVEPADGPPRVFSVETDIERQYLRKQACKTLGLDPSDADWQSNPFRDRMQSTADRLNGVLEDAIAGVALPTVGSA